MAVWDYMKRGGLNLKHPFDGVKDEEGKKE